MLGHETWLELWLAGPTVVREGVPLGRISVITSALFAVVAAALLVGQTRYADFEGRIAALALAAAILLLLVVPPRSVRSRARGV